MRKWVDDARVEMELPPVTPVTPPAPAIPRAAGTSSIPSLAARNGTVVVFADHRPTRARICDHIRAQRLEPLPVTTGLEAVLTLERASPRLAIIALPALGGPPHGILDFLDGEHPEIETALLTGHAHIGRALFERVSRWARDFGDLQEILALLTAQPQPLTR